jgi:hypothetical protein
MVLINLNSLSFESHNIIRCGKGVSPRPTLNRKIYKDHVRGHNIQERLPLPVECVPYINSVIDSVRKFYIIGGFYII